MLHFLRPEPFDAIIPDALPAKRALTYASGVAELAGAAGLLLKPDRRVGWALWARLPFQALAIWAVLAATRPDSPDRPPDET